MTRAAHHPAKTIGSIHTLLRPDGPDFLRAAYRGLLGRDPDQDGFAHYLAQIRNGTVKSEVLKQICDSDEYKEKGLEVAGLASHLRKYRLRRWLSRAVDRATRSSGPARGVGPDAVVATAPYGVDQQLVERLEAIEEVVRGLSADAVEERIDNLFLAFNGPTYLDQNPDVASAGMNPYEHWVLNGHRERRRWGLPNASVPVAGASLEAPLAVPDGVWEWADHGPLQDQIVAARQARVGEFAPTPVKLRHVSESDTSAVIAALAFPAPAEQPDVSIIIPVYNHLALTLECLQSIEAHTTGSLTYEIILTDDCSDPDVSAALSSVRNVRYRRNDSNQGFLRNCNAAIPLARGRWILFLNNDVQVPDRWLADLKSAFDIAPAVGIVGPAFVYPSGHLQEAGGVFRIDGTAVMVGLNEDPNLPAYSYPRRVDYVSGACLMVRRELLERLGGFSEDFLPCYCEDSDLCLRAQAAGFEVWVDPRVRVVHHLSRTTGAIEGDFKLRAATKNIATLARHHADSLATRLPRTLAFYLPQFHPFPENNLWWGEGFTEWTNVAKARPNFSGHYQPRQPADLGFYDLRLNQVMQDQAALARRYGIDGFCFYYYWFGGKRLLEQPLEQMLEVGKPDFPFCLCWANENWTRRWDGRDRDVLIAQAHSNDDDLKVIEDLSRYFRDARYIRVDGRPLLLVYRVSLFPDFAATAARWRRHCRDSGIGEIYLAMVESFELVHAGTHPREYGCDAAVEFPPQGLAEMTAPKGPVLNPQFSGHVASYRDLAVAYATREAAAYTRFKGVMPGWDNTARRQNDGLSFDGSSPGAFQAWLTDALEQTMRHRHGDERLVFVNAWNEWAEGAYLEPDRRFGHAFLNAVRNARDAALLRANGPGI